MDLGISGRVALLCGASGGLGSATARLLAAEGAAVVLAGRHTAALEHLAAELGGGVRKLVLPWDLSDLASIDSQVATIERELGPVDILFNNSGGPPPGGAQSFATEVWTQYFQSMVASLIQLSARIIPGMKARRWGRVITTTSAGVIAPLPDLALSNSLRLALVGWSKTLAREVAPEGITVNVVVPGRIDTRRVQELDRARALREHRALAEVQTASAASIPVGRYGTPQEFAAAVAFLASSQASYVTGSVLRVDGGLIASL